ncbi:hypothetical protein CEXT_618961 [Caerostris extrusa]|uniref:Uncharacterized protein n=1 Tax=Caerostris extrusa TaxID=172846 RepID=A0AAV4T3E4_CAEEX|nr:hypothetical protein CEXT_618961 [Caerostris extrusa]
MRQPKCELSDTINFLDHDHGHNKSLSFKNFPSREGAKQSLNFSVTLQLPRSMIMGIINRYTGRSFPFWLGNVTEGEDEYPRYNPAF